MEAEIVIALAVAVISGLFAVVARMMYPRVKRDATIVDTALSMVDELRRQNSELKAENEELRNRD